MDAEIYGNGNAYNFGARIYDNRIARWMSLDPAAKEYPEFSDYIFVANSPLSFIDPTGAVVEPADNLTQAQKSRVQAAIKLSKERLPKLYTYLNQVKFHSSTGTFITKEHEDYNNKEEAFDVIIKVGIKDLDGRPRKQEIIEFGSSNTKFRFQPEKHLSGRTSFNAQYAGIKENSDGSYSTWRKDNREEVIISAPDQLDGIDTYAKYSLDDGEVHFSIYLDDYLGSSETDGSVLSHEFGHAEADLLYLINSFYFGKVYEGKDEGAHEPGNKSGENADKREQEFRDAK
jgi:RHS repeat-associated protein